MNRVKDLFHSVDDLEAQRAGHWTIDGSINLTRVAEFNGCSLPAMIQCLKDFGIHWEDADAYAKLFVSRDEGIGVFDYLTGHQADRLSGCPLPPVGKNTAVEVVEGWVEVRTRFHRECEMAPQTAVLVWDDALEHFREYWSGWEPNLDIPADEFFMLRDAALDAFHDYYEFEMEARRANPEHVPWSLNPTASITEAVEEYVKEAPRAWE